MAKKYKCPYCEDRYIRKDLINHIDKKHEEMIPDGFTSSQIVFDLANGTNGHGKCRVCGGPTNWNQSSGRYDVLCLKPSCKQKMRDDYKKNMLKVYGTYNILNDDEQQKKMLANRSISGKYRFSDGTMVTYTGSYEKKFLEFVDKVMQIPSKDIIAPGPTIEYEMNGEKHFYITDFLYVPYNAIIEIKDGGDNPNTKDSNGMRSSRQRTLEKERLITNQGIYHYLRLTDNNFMQLVDFFMDIKKGLLEGIDDKVIKVNESVDIFPSGWFADYADEDLYNEVLNRSMNESYISEGTKSVINKNYKPKGKKNLSSFKRVHITEQVIDKYKKEYPFLKHVRCKDTDYYVCDGYIWFDDDNLVAMVGSCEYLDDKTKWIVSLEITKDYKGYGLSKQILDYAVKTMNCKYLSVNKNNQIAKKVYDGYGFKVYQESDTMYYMTIDKNANIKESYLEESLKNAVNDKGEKVPEICPKCGSKVAVFIQGEPVYLCTNCKKYFGVVPFHSNKKKIKEAADLDLTKFGAYHLELKRDGFNKDPKLHGWDEEQYFKDMRYAVNQMKYDHITEPVKAYCYTAGNDLRPLYLGTITIYPVEDGLDWEWADQEDISKDDYENILANPMCESALSNFILD